MDHKEQHHQHHQHEREEHKKEEQRHEHAWAKNAAPLHPAWIWSLGLALVLGAVLIWTFYPW